jgi:hypothetical protein
LQDIFRSHNSPHWLAVYLSEENLDYNTVRIWLNGREKPTSSKNLALAKAVWYTIRAFPSTPRKLDCGILSIERTHSLRFLTVSLEDQEDGKDCL